MSVSPPRGATNVPLDAAIAIATNAGFVRSVRAVASNGTRVAGATVPAGTSWWAHGVLLPGTTYRITAHIADANGVSVPVSSTFTTLVPASTVHATVTPANNSVVGVGQPIVVRFDQPINDPTARKAVLSHFRIVGPHRLAGGWHWFSSYELHFRPKALWPAGEFVTVKTDLDGWNAGNGAWGSGAQQENFAIANAHVATANLTTHLMTVTDNGKTIATYPFSGGREQYPTMNGIHIVMDREPVVHMVSSTNGIPVNSPDGYDELVYSDVHISDSGEYVHAAPWSVGSQGRANVSHGCVNLSAANAQAFYDFSRVGDIVIVTGGPRPPEVGDHGVMDWDTSWDQWSPAVVHSNVPPPLPAPRTELHNQ